MADKRELKRQYLDKMVPAGIFVIRNKVNNRAYVGGAMNVEGAMNRNRFDLEMKAHRNRKLMTDWLQHGPANFSFEVIDTLKQREDPAFDYQTELQALIEIWREEYQSYGENGYNQSTQRTAG